MQIASQSALRSFPLLILEIAVDPHLQFSQAAGLRRLFSTRVFCLSKSISLSTFFQLIMTDYTKLTSEVLRLLCQQSSLPIQGNRQALITRLKNQQQQQSKRTASRSPATRSKRQKTSSTRVRAPEVTPDVEPTEELDDQAVISTPDANTSGKEPHSEAQPPITVDQITSIVSAIVESKLATLNNTSGRVNDSTGDSAVNLGDPNSVQQLLSTPASNSGDLAAHVDEKTRKAILKGEYVDFVSLLHENSTASSTISDLLTLTVNGESLPISFPSQRRAKKVPIDSFDRWLSAFSVFSTVLLSAFPHRAVEMFAYLSIIQSAHKKFLGLSWLAYDIDFRRRAAQDPTLTWSKIHPQLYLEKFTGMSRSACFTCGGADHMSHSCPLSSRRVNQSPGGDPCRNFNRGIACIRTPCPYPHRCSVDNCNEAHPATTHPSKRLGTSSKSSYHKRR